MINKKNLWTIYSQQLHGRSSQLGIITNVLRGSQPLAVKWPKQLAVWHKN